MKRFASHYLYLPNKGFMKQYVIEMERGYVVNFYPLTEEIESVEWMPGVIELAPQEDKLYAFILYPFDFKTMQPVAGTQRRQLR